MTVDELNESNAECARAELLKCCGSSNWAREVVSARPFAHADELFSRAEEVWWSLAEADWLEAFQAHPKIGGKKAARQQSHQEQSWSSQEQSAMESASADTIAQLAEGNGKYETKFGFIFIVCASGKSSEEMLAILNNRLKNDPQTELSVAAQEQQKITRLRLEKLLS